MQFSAITGRLQAGGQRLRARDGTWNMHNGLLTAWFAPAVGRLSK